MMLKSNPSPNPLTYLSRCNGKFRVIHRAQAISADKFTADAALAVAKHCALTVSTVAAWDGDLGQFTAFTPAFCRSPFPITSAFS